MSRRKSLPRCSARGAPRVSASPIANERRDCRYGRSIDALQGRHPGNSVSPPRRGQVTRDIIHDAGRIGAMAARASLGIGPQARIGRVFDSLHRLARQSRTVPQVGGGLFRWEAERKTDSACGRLGWVHLHAIMPCLCYSSGPLPTLLLWKHLLLASDSGLTFSIRHLPFSHLLSRKPWVKPALS
jgi:hypothetical protein